MAAIAASFTITGIALSLADNRPRVRGKLVNGRLRTSDRTSWLGPQTSGRGIRHVDNGSLIRSEPSEIPHDKRCLLHVSCGVRGRFLPSLWPRRAEPSLADYIRPLVGTQGEGNTYPGPTAPFGMVQLSPDTDKDVLDAASGYVYSDTTILGFSLTHLSGTGVPDLGDFLFMPQIGKAGDRAGHQDSTRTRATSRASRTPTKRPRPATTG